jgi:hypothetical protein
MVNERIEFKDASQISSSAAKAVSIVQRSGILNGKPGIYLIPRAVQQEPKLQKLKNTYGYNG